MLDDDSDDDDEQAEVKHETDGVAGMEAAFDPVVKQEKDGNDEDADYEPDLNDGSYDFDIA